MKNLSGYGYQWKQYPQFCRSASIAAGNTSPDCPSTCWFWLLAIGVLGAATLLPVKRRAA